MARFSEREGHVTPQGLQRDDISERLRNRLEVFLDRAQPLNRRLANNNLPTEFERELRERFFAFSLRDQTRTREALAELFRDGPWHRVYDLLEFAYATLPRGLQGSFARQCNKILKEETSAYRFVGAHIVALTDENEVEAVVQGLGNPRAEVAGHIERACSSFAQRPVPDYPNSVKEAISAVEAMTRVLANDPNATLGQALSVITKQGKVPLHPALNSAFSKLYGWTSDAGGIRHADRPGDATQVDESLARFMLVTCSAFINYLTALHIGHSAP